MKNSQLPHQAQAEILLRSIMAADAAIWAQRMQARNLRISAEEVDRRDSYEPEHQTSGEPWDGGTYSIGTP
jgi:hypothetical protein